MRSLYYCSILLLLTQCSVNEEQEAFIEQLTSNNWYLPDASNLNIPSSTPLIFNSDGSFTDNFTDIDGITHRIVYKINRIVEFSFAYYSFELPVNNHVVNLELGVGIGFNTILRPVVFQGQFKKENTLPSVSATTMQKIKWYEETYTIDNYIQHAGNLADTIAIQ